MAQRIRCGHFRPGYTLVEMLVASASAAILLAGISGSLVIASRAFDETDGEISESIAAGSIGDQIMTEMRYATRFYERTPHAVTFNVPDRDGDGSEEQFRYAWSGIAGEPLTKEMNGSAPAVLLAGIKNLNFTYLTRTISGAGQPNIFKPQVVFEGFSEATNADPRATSLNIGLPSGTAAGDLLVAAVAIEGDATGSLKPALAGWNLVQVRASNAKVTFGVWWKLADAGESPSQAFLWSGAKRQAYAWVMRFTGHQATNPINAVAVDKGSKTSPPSPAVTTTVDSALILRLGGFEKNFVLDQPGLPGHIAITMDGTTTASGGAGYVEPVATGNSGSSAFSLTARASYVTVTMAIAPATE